MHAMQGKNSSESTKLRRNKNDVSHSSRPETIDVYIRMNEDSNKDYCFHVPKNETVSWLFKIFDVIPINLSPSYFFDDKPIGFSLSVHPGYLTAEGGLLFSDKAHYSEWLKPISNEAIIGNVIAEGQLIVPTWKHLYKREVRVISALMVWLYLDLPEYISPTPGTAPSKLIYWLINETLFTPKEPNPEQSLFNVPGWQIVFFVFHIIKVCFLYLILWNGLWHPSTLNPLTPTRYRKEHMKPPKAEQLNSIGWTGARRCGYLEWSERYMNYKTKKAGGVVEAYREGILTKPVGLDLGPGEGWNALRNKTIDEVEVESDLLDSDGKFVVSNAYFRELSKPLIKNISNLERGGAKEAELIKQFRECGGYDGGNILKELFEDIYKVSELSKDANVS